jgi:hypothetical protein
MNKPIEDIIKNKNLKKFEKLSNILKYIFVDVAEIDQNKYYILGSFAIRNHRTINDLDINLDETEFLKLEKVTKQGLGKIEFYNGQIRWIIDLTSEYNKLTGSNESDFSIEAFQKKPSVGFPNEDYSLEKLVKNNNLDKDENSHQFFKLETLLGWKKTMGRPKDTPDIELITELLKDYKNVKGGKASTKKGSKKSSKKGSNKKASIKASIKAAKANKSSKKGSNKKGGGKESSKKSSKKGSNKKGSNIKASKAKGTK